jgi:hypothetical protein
MTPRTQTKQDLLAFQNILKVREQELVDSIIDYPVSRWKKFRRETLATNELFQLEVARKLSSMED